MYWDGGPVFSPVHDEGICDPVIHNIKKTQFDTEPLLLRWPLDFPVQEDTVLDLAYLDERETAELLLK